MVMTRSKNDMDARTIASIIDAKISALPLSNTPSVRHIRREFSRLLQAASPELVMQVARVLIQAYSRRWVAYELIRDHKAAFACLSERELEKFGQGISSWWTVDSFARTLAGPAWLANQIPDDLIIRWAHSDDLWWRRAALVSTVALNVRSHDGHGDTERTLAICQILAGDHEDMVAKALSWALRQLSVHDPDSVRAFLEANSNVLARRVKREVTNKLITGLKNP
jgi:3-methyladenine DNA glycosylase AlkD